MLIHVPALSKLFYFVVTLNAAVKDGLDVISVWMLTEKKVCDYKELVSWKAGKFCLFVSICVFSVLGKM